MILGEGALGEILLWAPSPQYQETQVQLHCLHFLYLCT